MSKFAYQCLFLLVFITLAKCQWKDRPDADKYFYNKPIVVPAAEGDYHYTMIKDDTVTTAGIPHASYAKIGIMLLDGVFTFTGIDERWFHLLKPSTGNKKCLPFYGTNVVHKCEDEYFLLNSDFLDLSRQIFNQGSKLDTFCQAHVGRDLYSKVSDPNNYMVRFGRRVLMAYKEDANKQKCIGTYDSEDDQFSCLRPEEHGGNTVLKALRIDGFLYDSITSQMHRDDNTVEVFCKKMHKQRQK